MKLQAVVNRLTLLPPRRGRGRNALTVKENRVQLKVES